MEVASTSEARSFGKYTLVAKLATGGMAEIFLARLRGDGGFEKLVCIKRILPHLARDPQFVAMFLDEARVAARISHPNVCQVFELGEWHGQYYIAMEYLEGVPLACFRRPDYYPLPPEPRLVAGVGVQACEGLHHAHQLKRPDGEALGVVHRDISPQNLFVTIDGIVKVLDFGIAKVQDASVRTSTGAVKGTYAYMSPEQLRNEGLDRRTDIWALGAVLWETLAQRHLFKRDTEFLTFQAITSDPIQDICEVRPDVPPLLGDTIMRALSRNPDERFASARAFGEALAQAVGPLGGALPASGLGEEVTQSFQGQLAEQATLLRIAREGGQFDLEAESSLVGHGTQLATTPVSNLLQRVEDAQAEVAQYAAANAAIDSLVADSSQPGLGRAGSDGAFTPAPGRLPQAPARQSSPYPAQRQSSPYPAQRQSSPYPAQRQSSPYPAQRQSQPYAAEPTSGDYAVAPSEWHQRDNTPMPAPLPTSTMPIAPAPSSRLPWIIAIVAVAVASAAGAMLYVTLRTKPAPPAEGKTIAMHASSGETGSNGGAAAAAGPDQHVAPTPPPTPSAGSGGVGSGEAPAVGSGHEPAANDGDGKHGDAKDGDGKDGDGKDAKSGDGKHGDGKDGSALERPKVTRPEHPVTHPDKHPPKPLQVGERPSGPPGFITIDSAPVYAVIFVDGKRLGETPLVHISLSPGKHAVRAVSPSGATKTLSIHIVSGKTAPVRKIEW